MKKTNVIIIDDEPKCIEILTIMLQEHQNNIKVLDSGSSMSEGLSLVEKHRNNFDILFLDIQMPGGDGFALLQGLPEINFRIIFTTAYDHFAIRAIRFSALDYLLKPINNNELTGALHKFAFDNTKEKSAVNHFQAGLQKQAVFEKLAVATLTDIKFIPLERISYIESDNNYSTIYLENKHRIVSSKNIGYYEELLELSGFFRINNSNLVNLKKVQRFIKNKSGSVELENGQTLLVSPGRKEKLIKLLGLA